MKGIDFTLHKKILSGLADQVDEFYLCGGTALSLMYFHHRESYDLDFFTKEFSKAGILKIIAELKTRLKADIELIGEQTKAKMVKMLVYLVRFDKAAACKIDFVEDFIELIQPLRKIDGINVLSLEDIYLRKLYTVAGHVNAQDVIGQDIIIGGRQEAKDFYDLFCLSHTVTGLARFVLKCNDANLTEGIIRWYKTYDRLSMKTGLLDLVTSRKVDFRAMEKCFKNEIDLLIASEIDGS